MLIQGKKDFIYNLIMENFFNVKKFKMLHQNRITSHFEVTVTHLNTVIIKRLQELNTEGYIVINKNYFNIEKMHLS